MTRDPAFRYVSILKLIVLFEKVGLVNCACAIAGGGRQPSHWGAISYPAHSTYLCPAAEGRPLGSWEYEVDQTEGGKNGMAMSSPFSISDTVKKSRLAS